MVSVGTVTKACSEPDCDSPFYAFGHCYKHYLRMRRHGSLELPRRQRARPVCSSRGHTDADFVMVGTRRFCAKCETQRKRESRLRKLGLDDEAFARLSEAQGHACAICRRVPDHVLRIDHDHETGAVRGLLCHSCNVALGLLSDDAPRLRAAADYLEAR